MKHYLPGRLELAVFFGMAVICAVVARLSPYPDYALGLLGMPVFLIAAFLGNRRRVTRSEAIAGESEERKTTVTDL